jgi:hypothetical protein
VKNLVEFKQYIKDVVFLTQMSIGFEDNQNGNQKVTSQEIRKIAVSQKRRLLEVYESERYITRDKAEINITAIDKCTPAIKRNRRGMGS